MGSRAGTGVEVDLMHVPQRETGMTPYEIMLSESQERMLLVAEAGREDEVFRVFRKWGLDAVAIGLVTDDGVLRIKDHGQVVAEIPNRALADEAPLYDRPHTTPYRPVPITAPRGILDRRDGTTLQSDLVALVSSGDICSKRWIWEQYDYLVRSSTIEGPGADAAVVRIKETGTSIAMALDGNARYSVLDPREGARLIVAECCRNLSTAGALPVAATNNLNFGNPERPEIMAQLVESIEGIAEACRFFETPITGGNVSLYNETLGEAIWPTPVMGIVGLMKTAKPTPIHFQQPGRAVLLLGRFGTCDETRFGGTQYVKVVLKSLWGLPPALDLHYEKRVQQAIREIVGAGLAESAHDISDGGFAVALAECCFGSAVIGASVELDLSDPLEIALFHENPSRILISTADAPAVLELASKFHVECAQIGVTMKERVQISNRSKWLIDCPLHDLKQSWDQALETRLTRS
jgi:phosphoribosylformylglycinamidine synthase